MGNTCATVKKSKEKSNGRKESAESIPYGQQQQQQQQQQSPEVENVTSVECHTAATNIHTASDTANAQADTKLGSTSAPSSTIAPSSSSSSSQPPPPPPPHPASLSPIPPASTPSPYSTPYGSNGTGSGPGGVYQNISPAKGHISLSQYCESTRASSFTQLFQLWTDQNEDSGEIGLEDYYVIAASTESDELVVWSVYEQRAVRTLQNIPRPRDVRMVDQFQAVVLCNRELMLVDLNQATLVTKLKGVMNQKMPYYGLHNDQYVVALSRNRMYVNMINLSTGDLETTFKAGEDRFLNSLLTSANGKICVCGDETQKPFPLLVWDLSNRKLLYDLRIPHHEFITRLSAISDDGHYVVCVSQECQSASANFLIVYDLQSGTLFKKWKPECDSVSVAISTQCGGCVINGIANNDVLVWDLSTGNIKYTLTGHTAPPDLLQPALKANIFISYNSSRKDPKLCIWSLEEGTCLWTFTPEKEISCCCLTPNGMGIVYGNVGEKTLQLAVRKEAEEAEVYIEKMKSQTIPYGDHELTSQIIDLKKSVN